MAKWFRRACAPVAIALCTGGAGVAEAQSAPPPDPIPKPANPATHLTRGAWLEGHLGQLVSDCNIAIPLRAKWKEGFFTKEKAVSAVPAKLRSKINIATPIVEMRDGDVTRLFGAIWTTDNLVTANHTNTDYLDLDYGSGDDQVTMPGISASRYMNSCSSVISASVGANGEFDLGVAAIKAALESSFNDNQYSRLDLVTGTFESPISAAIGGTLKGVPPSAQRFVAAMLVWQWYENNPTRIGKPAFLLQSFTGDALYKRYSSGTDFGGTVSTSARLKALGAGLDAATSVKMNATDALTGSSYRVAVERMASGLNAQMQPLPAMPWVLTEAALATFQPFSADQSQIVKAGAERIIVQRIANFPRSYCDNSLWTAAPVLANVEAIDPSSAAGQGRLTTCQFTFKYVATVADAASGTTVTPEISRTIVVDNVTRHTLKIAGIPVTIPGSSLRVAKQASVSKAQIAAGGLSVVRLSWDSSWLIYGTAPLTSAPVELISAQLTCPNDLAVNQPISEITQPTAGASPRSFRIAFVTQSDGTVEQWSARTAAATCKIRPTIAIHTTSGDVQQSLDELSVLYPVPTPPPVPAPPAAPPPTTPTS